MMECKSLISDFLYFGVGGVEYDSGVVRNVAVVTEGEARGHGVWLDSEFVDAVVEMGNARRSGIKARFGHPSMSSTALGTFLGRFKNFRRVDENGVAMARADLFLSNSASETPHGDLREYVLNLAENDPEAFGASIVFEPADYYQRTEEGAKRIVDGPWSSDEKVFVEMGSLRAADLVDDPAANPEGLFASGWSKETFAGQVSEFLDTHPQIFELLLKKPEIVEGFLKRYAAYVDRKGQKMKNGMAEAMNAEAEAEAEANAELEAAAEVEAEAKQEAEAEAELAESESAEAEADEAEAPIEGDEEAEEMQEEEANAETADAEEAEAEADESAEANRAEEQMHSGQDFLDAFGEKGGVWFAKGLSFAEAKDCHIADLQSQLNAAKEKIADYEGESPASFDSEPAAAGDFVQQAKALSASEGITFTAAAKRIAAQNPELYAAYKRGEG